MNAATPLDIAPAAEEAHELAACRIVTDPRSPLGGRLEPSAGATERERQRVRDGARQLAGVRIPALAELRSADSGAIWCPVTDIGCVEDLPALGWKLPQKLALLHAVGTALQSLHDAKLRHGSLSPRSILLDGDFQPIVHEALVSDLGDPSTQQRAMATHVPYAAPELLAGSPPTNASDVFSLGKLLHFLLTGSVPPMTDEALARLVDLARAPVGLARIVRRATAREPRLRYPSVAAMLADVARYGEHDEVGLAHAGAVEQNWTGISNPPEHYLRGAEPVRIEIIEPEPSRAQPNHARWVAAGAALFVVAATLVAWADPMRALEVAAARSDLTASESTLRGSAVERLVELGERRLDGFDGTDAQLADLDLSGASLRRATLVRASLVGADLTGADLTGADLTSADIRGTDLAGADISGVSTLASARCDDETRLPDGWQCRAETPHRTTREEPE